MVRCTGTAVRDTADPIGDFSILTDHARK
eukprot:SAG31_NODE_5234_length_2659_cov_1.547266_3_plen_28_part_01